MNTKLPRHIVVAIVTLSLASSSTSAGLIDHIAQGTGYTITVTIEGRSLRFTDNTNDHGNLRIYDNPGAGATAATQLGIVCNSKISSILSVPLSSDPLLPTTRLDSLFDGEGLDTSGNSLRELVIFNRNGAAFTLDLDQVETIGGTVPEPTSFALGLLMLPALLTRRP